MNEEIQKFILSVEEVSAIRTALQDCDGDWVLQVRTDVEWIDAENTVNHSIFSSSPKPKVTTKTLCSLTEHQVEGVNGYALGLKYDYTTTNLGDLHKINELLKIERLAIFAIHDVFGIDKPAQFKDLAQCEPLSHLKDLTLNGCCLLSDLSTLGKAPNLSKLSLSYCESLSNIDGLRGFPNLRNINLSYCKSLTNLQGLECLKNLTDLDVNSCPSLSNVDGLREVPNLRNVNLSYCKSLTNVHGLRVLNHLTKLDLHTCESLSDISGLQGLENLKYLDLHSNESLLHLHDLFDVNGLESLNLEMNYSLSDWKGLRNLTGLKELKINGGGFSNVSYLENLLELHTLKLQECKSLTDITALQNLTGIHQLDLCYCSSLSNVNGLQNLNQLTHLKLGSCDSLTDISSLQGLESLTEIDMSGCASLSNLNGLSDLMNLKTLDLNSSSALTDIRGLQNLPSLTHLQLNYCQSLRNIQGLEGLKGLQSLDLSSCSSLSDFRGLKDLRDLRDVDLSGCGITHANDISSLVSLERLEMHFCEGLTDINGLRHLDSLRHLGLVMSQKISIIQPLQYCTSLTSLDLDGCGNIRDLDSLGSLPNLKTLSWTETTTPNAVLASSATIRKDHTFIKNNIVEWVNSLALSKTPNSHAQKFITACQIGTDMDWSIDALTNLARVSRKRGLQGNESLNEMKPDTWRLWSLTALDLGFPRCTKPFETALTEIDPFRENLSVLRPLLTTLSDLSSQTTETREWALGLVGGVLDSLPSDPDVLRDAAVGAAVFYASFDDENKVRQWLDHGSHQHSPRWRDRIYVALINWASEKKKYKQARLWLGEIVTTELRDPAHATFARQLAQISPHDAVQEHLEQIESKALQLVVAQELMFEPKITGQKESLYGLLLILQQQPDTLAEFIEKIVVQHPNSSLVEEIASIFGSQETEVAKQIDDAEIISTILDHEHWMEFIPKRKFMKYKESLSQISCAQFIREAIAQRFVKEEILEEEECVQLLADWPKED